ncbi:hypothetical protein [Streptomyces sp. NPDC058045]|uniref:hypothetical protein n=1 Tax=Streptomyces sp. NPDC058045 TaxID=3346311 RepID=UPI0036EAE124
MAPALAAAAVLDPAALSPEEVQLALGMAGLGEGGALPERMAPVAVLRALPAPVAQRLLPEVIGCQYRAAY